jgi:hypothetical protein
LFVCINRIAKLPGKLTPSGRESFDSIEAMAAAKQRYGESGRG